MNKVLKPLHFLGMTVFAVSSLAAAEDRPAPPLFRTRFALAAARLLLSAVVLAFLLPGPAARGQMASFTPAGVKIDRAITITVTPHGFRPSRLDITAGAIALLIENRSPIQNLAVVVTQDGQSGTALTSQHTPTTADVWHFLIVQPGTYHFGVAALPSWKCTINVSAK